MRHRLESFLKAQKDYKNNSPIQTIMRDRLVGLLRATSRLEYENIFEFGCGQGELTKMLAKLLSYKHYACNDINRYDKSYLPPRSSMHYFDMNHIKSQKIFRNRFNLIASNACLQWLNFYETLENLHSMLVKNGILLIGTFGINNLKEVKNITGIGLQYIESDSIKLALSKNFDRIQWHEEEIKLDFKEALEVFRHLKASGVNALGANYFKKSWLVEYEKLFQNKLSYHTICFIARKK